MFDSKIISRFWAKVQIGTETECWLWTASKRNKGYGAFSYTLNGKLVQERAHRFSFLIHSGEIPDGMFVLHRCDVPDCVNPSHLFLGTNLDNINDMLTKGRHVAGGTYSRENYKKGEEHPGAILNAEIVRAIRSDRNSGLSLSQLAKKYELAIGHVHRIVLRKAWSHVE